MYHTEKNNGECPGSGTGTVAMELFVIGSEDAEVVHIARGYIDADPEVYKNPLQEHDVRRYVDAECQGYMNAEDEQNVRRDVYAVRKVRGDEQMDASAPF